MAALNPVTMAANPKFDCLYALFGLLLANTASPIL